MSLVITQAPETDVNGHLSRWQAVHHPIEFTLQRQDQQASMKYLPNSISTVRIKVIGSIPGTVAIGQRIKYVSPSQTFTSTIVNIIGVIIITDSVIDGHVNGGFVIYLDALTNYFVETNIFAAGLNNTYTLIGTMRNKADLCGVIKLRIQEWLQTESGVTNEFGYDVINKAMPKEGSRYAIQYRELHSGKESQFGDLTPLRFWTNSAKQIQDIYGFNMGDYVPTRDDTRPNKAKFQSVFARPTYFVGMPFSMSWIYSDNMLSYQMTREEVQYDQNGNVVLASSTDVNASQRTFANRLMLEQGYGATVNTVEVWLDVGDQIADAGYDMNTYQDGDIFLPFVDSPIIHPPPPTTGN